MTQPEAKLSSRTDRKGTICGVIGHLGRSDITWVVASQFTLNVRVRLSHTTLG
jgi:hypothetical protein